MAFTTPSDSSLHTLSVSELAEHCLSEVNTYRLGEPRDTRYYVELFRRATVQSDTVVRGAVEQCFHETMLAWLQSHPQKEVVCRLNNEEHYVTQAFTRFRHATARGEETACQDLATTLRYLRASLHGTLLDAIRASSISRSVPLPEPTEPGTMHVQGHDEGQAVWEGIQRLLPDEREQQAGNLMPQPPWIETQALEEPLVVGHLTSGTHRLGAEAAQLDGAMALLIERRASQQVPSFRTQHPKFALRLLERVQREACAKDERGGEAQLGKSRFKHKTLLCTVHEKIGPRSPGAMGNRLRGAGLSFLSLVKLAFGSAACSSLLLRAFLGIFLLDLAPLASQRALACQTVEAIVTYP